MGKKKIDHCTSSLNDRINVRIWQGTLFLESSSVRCRSISPRGVATCLCVTSWLTRPTERKLFGAASSWTQHRSSFCPATGASIALCNAHKVHWTTAASVYSFLSLCYAVVMSSINASRLILRVLPPFRDYFCEKFHDSSAIKKNKNFPFAYANETL